MGAAAAPGPAGPPQDRPAVAGAVNRDPREGKITFRAALARHPGRAAELRAWMAQETESDGGPDAMLWCGFCQRAVPAGDVFVAPVKPGHHAYAEGKRLYTVCPATMTCGLPCTHGLLSGWDSARLTWQDGPRDHWPEIPKAYEKYERAPPGGERLRPSVNPYRAACP